MIDIKNSLIIRTISSYNKSELKVAYKNVSEKIIEKPISVWKNHTKSIDISLPEGKISFLELGSETIPDAYTENKGLDL